jgi:hypothetical protein
MKKLRSPAWERCGFLLVLLLVADFSALAQVPVNVAAWGANDYGQCDIPVGLNDAVGISAGATHSLAARADGTVAAWGDNGCGCCTVPAECTNVLAVSAGVYQSFALRADGTVIGWGCPYGRAFQIPGLSNAIAVAAISIYDGMALCADGQVFQFGYVMTGGSGDLDFYSAIDPGLTDVTAICGGVYHVLALETGGRVLAWGPNFEGGCDTPADLTNAVAVAAGFLHSLAIRTGGRVVAWGSNDYGEGAVPAELTNAVAVACGAHFSLGLKADGKVLAWGTNDAGQCDVPTNLTNVTALSAGNRHSLALLSSPTPNIVGYPKLLDQVVAIGATLEFAVRATGFPPLRFQWFSGADPILGASNSRLVLRKVSASQSGQYHVTVSNTYGSATSRAASLQVLPSLKVCVLPSSEPLIILNCEIGSTYQLQRRASLGPTDTWQPLGSILITNNPQTVPDVSAGGLQQGFYRLLRQ